MSDLGALSIVYLLITHDSSKFTQLELMFSLKSTLPAHIEFQKKKLPEVENINIKKMIRLTIFRKH